MSTTDDPQRRLSTNIRTLGNLLGETIVEQEGAQESNPSSSTKLFEKPVTRRGPEDRETGPKGRGGASHLDLQAPRGMPVQRGDEHRRRLSALPVRNPTDRAGLFGAPTIPGRDPGSAGAASWLASGLLPNERGGVGAHALTTAWVAADPEG
jgi:hypothetical protein